MHKRLFDGIRKEMEQRWCGIIYMQCGHCELYWKYFLAVNWATCPQPQLTLLLLISFTFGVIHVHSHPVLSSIQRPMGSEEDMPNHPIFEQIGGRFGRFDSAVHISFPLPSCLIFTLTPAPADPNMHLLLPRALQPHPCITLRCSDHPQTRMVP